MRARQRLDLKQEVFAQLEKLSPPQIPLTSNSSGLPISKIGKGLKTQSRMLGLHFFMPAHLAPLVEAGLFGKPPTLVWPGKFTI